MKSPVSFPALLLRILLALCVCFLTASAALAESAPPSDSSKPSQANTSPLPDSPAVVLIPGPLRSFLRMAGISQTVSSEEVLPLLAREVFFLGYRGTTPTEFLILLNRYVSQARELSALAGSEAVIRVSNCAEAEQLLHILGYRIREKCGESNASLFTSEPERAFLTIDSGFPLTELEQTIQGGKPFVYEYSSTSVPVLFTEDAWTTIKSNKKLDSKNLIDRLLRDPDLALLYWALSRMDQDTVATLRTSPGLEKLLPYASLLNFYGSEICIRSGRVVVPGGSDAETAWKDLVGVSSEAQGEFVLRLLKKDRGWLAAFFDALSHTSQAQQAHFTDVRAS